MSTVCGCCTPAAPPTPRRVENRPGLPAVAYRIGTFASFREAMLERIAAAPELTRLTSRAGDDFAIGVLEQWAAVADVLTFYQERYANEAYLRTARWPESVARLAALLDYRLRPGIAARALIAFTLDAGKRFLVPAGQKVQSVPGPGEQPQTFETLEPLAADARWNRLRALPAPLARNALARRRTRANLDRLRGASLAAALAPGATVVLFDDGATRQVEEKKVAALAIADDLAAVVWTAPVQHRGWSAATQAFEFRRTFRLFGHNAPATYPQPSQPAPGRVLWDLVSTGSFGLPAGRFIDLEGKVDNLAAGQQLLVADTGGGGAKTLVTVQSIVQAKAAFGPLAETVTRVEVRPVRAGVRLLPAIGDRRQALVYELRGAPLAFWPFDYPRELRAGAGAAGAEVYLPGVAVADARGRGVEVGRTIKQGAYVPGEVLYLDDVGRGRRLLVVDGDGKVAGAAVQGAPRIEPAEAAPGRFCHLVLALEVDGTLLHDSVSAALLGNVAAASHGETVQGERVGSGDATRPFARLALQKKPLTYLPGSGPDGIASTLELQVDGTSWAEVAELFGQPAQAPVFEARLAGDGTTVVQFGDGTTGAIPATGRNNVTATYRVGSGLAGRVAAGSLSTLLAKPPGLAAATNPLPAEGGADPEGAAAARDNAPRSVRTFGRIVSLLDFADQATAGGEVAKALATWLWDGLDRAIHLTVAGQQGALLGAAARRQLGDRLRAVRDPNHRLRIDNYAQVYLEVRAGIATEPERDREVVLAAARQALLAALSFDALSLGESIHLSEVLRILQDVPGVRFVEIDRLLVKHLAGVPLADYLLDLERRRASFLPDGRPAPVQEHLRVFAARPDPALRGGVLPAELAAFAVPAEDLILEAREG
jgi:hypothetical protein